MTDTPSQDPQSTLHEAYLQFLELEERGEGDFEAFCREHPDLTLGLRELHDARQLLSGLHLSASQLSMGGATLRLLNNVPVGEVDPGISLEAEPEAADPATAAFYEDLAGRQALSARYRFKGEVARGGMGAILKVWDDDLRRSVAMKVILEHGRPGSSASALGRTLTRFLEEAQITGQLDHPGIVPVHELGVDAEGRAYFTMRLVRGRSLHDLLPKMRAEDDGWTRTRALQVVLRISETMAYAHSKGVIHRDLKPSNVMAGDFGEVYVMDWGLARVQGQSHEHQAVATLRHRSAEELEDGEATPALTRAGEVIGTPSYMSPEQASGDPDEVDERSDVYSLGALLYQLLAGHAPYGSPGSKPTARDVLVQLRKGPPPSLGEVDAQLPGELVAICEKAMARRPEQRYPTMLELGEDLRSFLEQRVVRAYETGAWAELKKWYGRNRKVALSLAAGTMLALIGLGSTFLVQERARVRLAEAGERALSSGYAAAVSAADGALRAGDVALARKLLGDVDPERRGWEWYLLASRLDASQATLFGHQGQIEVVAASLDGRRAATWTRNGQLRLWDLASQAELGRWQPPSNTRWPHQPAIDGDLRWYAHPIPQPQEQSSLVTLYDVATGKPERAFEVSDDRQQAVAFSSDGQLLALGGKALWIRDIQSGQLIYSSAALSDDRRLTRLAFSPDGKRIAGRDSSSYVHGWELPTTANQPGPLPIVPAFEPHRSPKFIGTALAFRPDGRQLAYGSDHNTVILWDWESQRVSQVLSGHDERPRCVAWHPDGEHLVTSAFDQTLRIWNRRSGNLVRTFLGHEGPANVAYLEGGRRLLSGSFDTTLKLWDVPEQAVRTPRQPKTGEFVLDVSRDGRVLASLDFDGTLTVLESASGAKLLERSLKGVAERCFDIDAAGRWVALPGEDNQIELWDLEASQPAPLVGHAAPVYGLAFDPAGRKLASVSSDGCLRLWDLSASPPTCHDIPGQDPLRSVGWSPDGRLVASGDDAGIVRVFDADGDLLQSLPSTGRPVWAVQPLAGGTRLAALSWPGNFFYDLDLFDLEHGTRRRLQRVPSWNRTRLVPSPDGERFFLSKIRGPGIPVHSARTGEELLVLRGETHGLGLNHGLMGFVGEGADELWAYDQIGKPVTFDIGPGQRVAQVFDARARAGQQLAPLWRRERIRGRVLESWLELPQGSPQAVDAVLRRAALEELREDPRDLWLALEELAYPLCTQEEGPAVWREVFEVLERLGSESSEAAVQRLRAWGAVRVGMGQEVRESLEEFTRPRQRHRAVSMLFLALVDLERGDTAQARERLERARTWREHGFDARYPWARNLMAEVEARLR